MNFDQWWKRENYQYDSPVSKDQIEAIARAAFEAGSKSHANTIWAVSGYPQLRYKEAEG